MKKFAAAPRLLPTRKANHSRRRPRLAARSRKVNVRLPHQVNVTATAKAGNQATYLFTPVINIVRYRASSFTRNPQVPTNAKRRKRISWTRLARSIIAFMAAQDREGRVFASKPCA